MFSTLDLGTLITSLSQLQPAGKTAFPDASLLEGTIILELLNAESPIAYSLAYKYSPGLQMILKFLQIGLPCPRPGQPTFA
jgi:hypothetical protein